MSVAYRQARLSPGELVQLKWLLGAVLSLLALSTMLVLEVNSAPLALLGMVITFVGMLLPHRVASIPEGFWKMLVPVLILVIIADFILSQPDIIAPLIRMVIMLTIIRILQQRRKREDMQLILLSLFMVVISGVLTLSLAFAVQIFLFAIGAMGLLFVINLAEFSRASLLSKDEVWSGFLWRRFLVRLWNHLDSRQLLLASALFTLLILISTIIFILTPRIELNQQFQLLEGGRSQSLAGFSEQVEFGEIADIIEDDRVAFRVDVPADFSGNEAPYWRMVALDEYVLRRDGMSTFRMSESARGNPDTSVRDRLSLPDSFSREGDGQWGSWTFYISPGISRYLPLVGTPEAVRFQGRQQTISFRPLAVVGIPEPSARTFFYQLEGVDSSDVIPATPLDSQLVNAERQLVEMLDRHQRSRVSYPLTTLGVPNDEATLEYLEHFLSEIVGDREVAEPLELAAMVTRYLHQGHGYSLSSAIPPGDGDLLMRWMASDQPGHCELFAGAFSLVMRYAGVPTRMVTGFRGGVWNAYEDYYMVRNRDAHAWVEVYVPERGWVRQDPTPGYGREDSLGTASDLLSTVGIDSTWRAYLDSLMVLWYRRVVNFDQSSQEAMAEQFKEGLKLIMEDIRDWLKSVWANIQAWFTGPWSSDKMRALMSIILPVVFLVVAWIAIRRIYRYWFLQNTRRGRNTLENKLRRRASQFLAKINDLQPKEEHRLQREIVRMALKEVRFGPEPDTTQAEIAFRQARDLLRGKP